MQNGSERDAGGEDGLMRRGFAIAKFSRGEIVAFIRQEAVGTVRVRSI